MIFRIYNSNNAQNTNSDGWAKMALNITSEQIQSIEDPKGGVPRHEITSIPSPWGRLDLVRTAFRNVVSSDQIKGSTLDHKLVSDTLDLAQICFHYERYAQQDLVKCLRWDRGAELKQLAQSPHRGHQELARAWEKYLKQDKSFNFDALDEFAIFYFVDPQTKASSIIGISSPVTLFCPAAGDLSHVSRHIFFGQDKPFDGDYAPLTEREDSFVLWLYALRLAYPQFAIYFKELYDYLELCKPQLNVALQAQINSLSAQSYTNDYAPVDFAPGMPMHILKDLMVYADRGNNVQAIAQRSDFVIRSSKNIDGSIPLVLPTKPMSQKLHYVTADWDENTQVPEQDAKALDQRILPADGSTYPYLTIGDFLEDKLICIKSDLNREYFYVGELDQLLTTPNQGESYLLPLKPRFFDYFSPRELREGKMLRFSRTGTLVVVELKIPIRGGVITYRREYQTPMMDANFSLGYKIKDIDTLGLGLIQTKVYSPMCYVLPKGTDVKLRGLSTQGEWIDVVHKTQQDTSHYSIYTSALEGEFELLRVELEEDCSGLIIPLPSNKESHESIEYAVDLGTTNTCIAYRLNGQGRPGLLDWSYGQMMTSLCKHKEDVGVRQILKSRLSPSRLGGELCFPQRTALRIDTDNPTFRSALLGLSPYLGYHLLADPMASKVMTNIKWSDDPNNAHLKAYIYGLCLWLRRHADIRAKDASVKITWLYPSSMTRKRRNDLKSIWEEASQKFFGRSVLVEQVNEAVAPYYYLTQDAGVQGRTVAMDIGGGTVDILITGSNDTEDMHLTSFLWGANTLYEAPTNLQGHGSGFARMLRDYLSEQKDRHGDLPDVLRRMQDFIDNHKSEEAVDLFFALAKREDLGLETDLGKLLGSPTQGRNRLLSVVLLYFALQVYHVAELIEAKGLKRPNYFVFSGNGSRILSVLGQELLGELITEIFDYVECKYHDTRTPRGIKVEFNPEPKASSSYGAVVRHKDRQIPEPARCLLLGNAKLATDDAKYQGGDEEIIYADLRDFAELFRSLLDGRLKLVKDWGYDKDSLDEVYKSLVDEEASRIIFDSYVRRELMPNGEGVEYSQSPLFDLMAHRIKEIAYSLYTNKE